MSTASKSAKRQSILISAALGLMVLLAFEPVRHNAFVEFDDNQYLMENSHIRSGVAVSSVAWAFTTGYAANWHPLTWLSHMADIQWFGLNPLGHHLHNVLLHALTTILLFLVLREMTGAMWRSALVAMLFGIHPLRVESVAWAAERKDVLCALFWILTMAAYVGYVRRGGVARYLLVVAVFALGLMAKPMLVTLPLVLLALDFWVFKRGSGKVVRGARCEVSGERGDSCMTPDTSHFALRTSYLAPLLVEKIPLFALVLVSCVVTWLVQRHGKSMTLDLPLAFRVSNALSSYVVYLGKIAWPRDLAVLYPYPVAWPLWRPVVAALVLAVGSVLVFNRRKTEPYLAAGWFWYGITLVPVIGLVQVGAQSMADRYTYLPSIGIFIMFAWGLARLTAGWRHQKLAGATLGILMAVAMIAATRTQVGYWKTSVALFERAVSVTRNNYTMHHSLGWALAKEGRLDEAAVHLARSLELRPDLETMLDMADVLIKQQQFDQAENYLARVLKAEPANSIAHYDRGIILQAREKIDEAIGAYDEAVRLDRNNAAAFNNLGILKIQQGRLDEASRCFHESLRSAPDKPTTHRNLGAVLQMQGRTGEAVAHFRIALQLDPGDVDASWNLAYAYHELGKLREAAASDRATLRLNPNHVPALNDLAWILATQPDRTVQNATEAIILARKACLLTEFKDASILDTLATAYAAANRFEEAKETARAAINEAKIAGDQDLAQTIEKRLQLYQRSKAYAEIME